MTGDRRKKNQNQKTVNQNRTQTKRKKIVSQIKQGQ